MQTFGMLGMAVVAVVTFAVGTRLLLLARRTRQLPELAFGSGFLCGAVGSAAGQLGQRLLWSEPGPLASVMNTACFGLMIFGTVMIFVAVWRIFRPDFAWAKLACALGSVVTLVAFGIRIADGDLVMGQIETRGLLLYMIARVALFVWISAEALRYHAMLRRRLALGLADPVATNQILLWGVAGMAMLGTQGTITTSIFLLHRHPFDLPAATALITLLCLLLSVSMWCAFFPPAALRRFVATHAPQVG
jgi:hypothetical protein